MKKILLISISAVLALTFMFAGCKKEAPSQPWLNETPIEMSVVSVTPPTFELQESQFKSVIEQIKKLKILGKSPKNIESIPGGINEIEIKYNDKTVSYSFNECGNDKKRFYVLSCSIDEEESQNWLISKEDYELVTGFFKELVWET